MAGPSNDPINHSGEEEEEEEEEEEDQSSEEGSGSESEPEKTPSLTPKPNPNNTSSDDSGSDSDQAPAKLPVPDLEPKPISKNQSLLNAVGKRPAPEVLAGDVKRVKKVVMAVAAPDAVIGGGGDAKKDPKELFKRLWSEENEVELIEGLISYVNDIKKDPFADVNDFHEFVKDSLHVDVNTKQMLNKVKRLRKKFENNYAKVENTGKVRSFSNPHEKKMYELSKMLWGSDGGSGVVKSSKKVNVTPKVVKGRKSGMGNGNVGNMGGESEVEPKMVQPLRAVRGGFGFGMDQGGLVGLMVTEEGIMNKGLELLSGAKKVEMEEKWRELKVMELEHFVEKVDLLKEQAEVVLNAIKKTGAN